MHHTGSVGVLIDTRPRSFTNDLFEVGREILKRSVRTYKPM